MEKTETLNTVPTVVVNCFQRIHSTVYFCIVGDQQNRREQAKATDELIAKWKTWADALAKVLDESGVSNELLGK